MMNAKKLEQAISSLVEGIASFHEKGYVSSACIEGEEYSTLQGFKEYCLIGNIDFVTEHEMCTHILAQVAPDMPKTATKLIWRTAPEYKTYEEPETGKKMHRVYLRLGWREV